VEDFQHRVPVTQQAYQVRTARGKQEELTIIAQLFHAGAAFLEQTRVIAKVIQKD